jgi:hypothetical protein
MISRKFKAALKLDPRPQYRLAWQAGINPTTLSQIVTGYIKVKQNDPRILKIGELLGLWPNECIEKSPRRNPYKEKTSHSEAG